MVQAAERNLHIIGARPGARASARLVGALVMAVSWASSASTASAQLTLHVSAGGCLDASTIERAVAAQRGSRSGTVTITVTCGPVVMTRAEIQVGGVELVRQLEVDERELPELAEAIALVVSVAVDLATEQASTGGRRPDEQPAPSGAPEDAEPAPRGQISEASNSESGSESAAEDEDPERTPPSSTRPQPPNVEIRGAIRLDLGRYVLASTGIGIAWMPTAIASVDVDLVIGAPRIFGFAPHGSVNLLSSSVRLGGCLTGRPFETDDVDLGISGCAGAWLGLVTSVSDGFDVANGASAGPHIAGSVRAATALVVSGWVVRLSAEAGLHFVSPRFFVLVDGERRVFANDSELLFGALTIQVGGRWRL